MARKAATAIVAAGLIALAAAPAGAQAKEFCPPGSHDHSPYCVKEEVGLTLVEHEAEAARNNDSVGVKLRCELEATCKGTLYLEGSAPGRHFSVRHALAARRHTTAHKHAIKGKACAHGRARQCSHGKPKKTRHRVPAIRIGVAYGVSPYRIEAHETSTLEVKLNGIARGQLQRNHQITVEVVAIARDVRSDLGKLTIKANKESEPPPRPGHGHGHGPHSGGHHHGR